MKGNRRIFVAGVVSDTHGLLRPELLEALSGVDCILHAGDVGDAAILAALRRIAPTTAIRGNIDHAGPCSLLPATEAVECGGKTIYLLHDRKELDLNPASAGFAAVISGHSHQPSIEWDRGVLYFNPGSAGPRRFSLPVSMGFLSITESALVPKLQRLV